MIDDKKQRLMLRRHYCKDSPEVYWKTVNPKHTEDIPASNKMVA